MCARLVVVNLHKYAFATMLALVSACGSVPVLPVAFEGESNAARWNKADIYNMLAPVVAGIHRCSSIDKIITSILQYPTGELGSQSAKESWDVYGCNQSFNFEVTLFQEGHNYFSLYTVTSGGSPLATGSSK